MLHRTFQHLAAIALFLGGAPLLPACSSPVPNRVPVGETLPSVRGDSLDGQEVRLPEDLAGRPAVLIVGYVQDSQFDADRWLYGFLQSQTPVQLYEVPTIKGFVPGLISGTIDEGMRSGIPSEDWSSVATLYGDDARRIVALTGNEKPRNVRVLLLDAEGIIRWFHDRGFSAGKLLELDRLARELAARR